MLLLTAIALVSCQEEKPAPFALTEKQQDFTTYQLTTYSSFNDSKYLVVFESGLGSGHSIWTANDLLFQISPLADVLLYDRAGYEKSTIDTNSIRNIETMRKDLETVIDSSKIDPEQKIILVGHSLGGFVIRDYVIKNPTKVAALLFVDTSHEDFLAMPQQAEDGMVADFTKKMGKNAGATKEASQLIEDIAYMKSLPNLPNIPICAISGLRRETNFSAKDKQRLFDTHQKLRNGVLDFTHVASTTTGHYVMNDDPYLIVHALQLLLSKLPK